MTPRPFRPALLLLFACALLLPACATLGGSSPNEDGDERERPPRTEEPPPREEPPAEEERGPRTVRGYRIQVLSTEDKGLADQRAAEVEDQWGGPVEVDWRAPYYRVRYGAFGSRGAAEAQLASVQEAYPDALLVPDTVTLY